MIALLSISFVMIQITQLPRTIAERLVFFVPFVSSIRKPVRLNIFFTLEMNYLCFTLYTMKGRTLIIIFGFNTAVDGVWTEWNEYGSCSTTCGVGIAERLRYCVNPPATDGGEICFGNGSETKACNLGECTSPGKDSSAAAPPPSDKLGSLRLLELKNLFTSGS